MTKRATNAARLCSAILLACFVVAFVFLAYPVYVIRPFRFQGPRELGVALAMLGVRGSVEIGCLVIAALGFLAGWRFWTSSKSRIFALAAFLLTALCAGLSSINIYEKMFHPIKTPEFEAITASNLKGTEMVLAVHAGEISRAYPIRVISYHHIVNDTLNGVPIVATY